VENDLEPDFPPVTVGGFYNRPVAKKGGVTNTLKIHELTGLALILLG
jgi:hypothetical protein